MSPDERLRVNDKQGKRHRERKSFQRGLFVVKFEGESVQMQSLHLGLLADKAKTILQKKIIILSPQNKHTRHVLEIAHL